MKEIKTFQNKKVLVLGLAKTGYQAALLLDKLGAEVTVNDKSVPEDLTHVHDLEEKGIKVITGYHPDDIVHPGLDYVVKNPGIPYKVAPVQKALSLNIPTITDVELAYLVSQAPIISVTGSNGKTTTTTLIAHMLTPNPSGGKTELAGNIGIPSTKVAQEVGPKDQIVMEMSSFQLMGVQSFRPEIALIVNIYEAHLDYHGSREAYVAAKLNLLKNQTADDIAIFNGDLEESYTFAKEAKGKVYFFSKTKQDCATYCIGDDIYVLGEKVLSKQDIQIPGDHNLENVLAAALVAKLKGQSNELIQKAVRQFSGVKHRTQFVGKYKGRYVYNDSKATNILATQNALKGFKDPVVLIAGGLDRGNGFEELAESLKKVKTLVLYGQTKEKIASVARSIGLEDLVLVDSLDQAVPVAFAHSQAEDTILLSPACASWDQFPSFEVRGDHFIALVEEEAKKDQ